MSEEVQDFDAELAKPDRRKSWWERKTGEKLTRFEKVAGILMLAVFLFVFSITLDANKYRAQVKTVPGDNYIGVNPTTEFLDFGDLSRGSTAKRSVKIKNETFMPFFVTAVRFGSITDLMTQNKNNFLVRRGEEAKIDFTVYMPASAELEHTYTGRVFVFKIPAPFL